MKNHFIIVCLLSLSFISISALAQKRSRATLASGIEGKTGGMTRYDGFYTFYYDPKTDRILLVVDRFNEEFLYVHSLASGLGSNDIGLDRSQLGGENVVYFERHGPKVLLIQSNYDYRAISDNPAERKAVEDAFAKSVLWGFTEITEEDGKILVDATDFFLQDEHDVAGTLKANDQGNFSVDKTRSAIFLDRTKNFPDNSEFEAIITLTGKDAGRNLRSVTPTDNSLTLRQHHSFVRLPDDNYKPRKFDPRAGYFAMSYYDYATPISKPLKKIYITRHRLEKKDPSAARSEPVKPIIYYLDPGTPEPIRSALLEGASWWNQAFEAAGYINAFQVKMLPDGADPMDVRYNMINWVHRSTRGWSYGSSVIDPRTGEIIKGHVLLGSLRVRQDYLIAEGLLAPYRNGEKVSPEMQQMALARLRQLAAHEVGHTLGLAHSYSSSTEDLASVMDYPYPLVSLKDGHIDLSNAYDNKIGEWDKTTIKYGYEVFPDSVDEEKSLDNIIMESLKNGLTFLSDQDARPAGGAHPYAHLWDNGSSPVEGLNDILKIRQVALKNFGENNIPPGTPYAQLEEVLVPIYFLHRFQTEAAIKMIGGLNYRYAIKGDGQPITGMVPVDEQKAALKGVLETISPETLTLDERIIKLIPPRPLGYNRTREMVKIRTGVTFDPLSNAESAAGMTLDLLFNPARAERLVEYHARDPKQPGLDWVINEVLDNTIKESVKDGLPGQVQMIVNDIVVNKLIDLARQPVSGSQVQALTLLKLQELDKWIKNSSGDGQEKAEFYRLNRMIDKFLQDPDKFQPKEFLSPPDGSPIGMTCEY